MMRKYFIILLFLISCSNVEQEISSTHKENTEFRNGDIIFQTSQSRQSKAIQIATKSKYSHMGIIYNQNGKYYVYEAVQPVKLTPLQQWINRGKDNHHVVKRLKNSDKVLTPEALKKMKEYGSRFKNKDYDIYFDWSDDKMYCSELVWKIYKNAIGVEIGNLETLGDFDLSNKTVSKIIKERYGDKIPINEKVISPKAMFDSDKLYLVKTETNN